MEIDEKLLQGIRSVLFMPSPIYYYCTHFPDISAAKREYLAAWRAWDSERPHFIGDFGHSIRNTKAFKRYLLQKNLF